MSGIVGDSGAVQDIRSIRQVGMDYSTGFAQDRDDRRTLEIDCGFRGGCA
jgi:hypothetical protein